MPFFTIVKIITFKMNKFNFTAGLNHVFFYMLYITSKIKKIRLIDKSTPFFSDLKGLYWKRINLTM